MSAHRGPTGRFSASPPKKAIRNRCNRRDVPAFEYVNTTEDRIDDLIEVLVNARADDPHERRLSREEARAFYIHDVDFDPNAAWIVLSEGEPIAFGWAVVEKNSVDAGMDDGFMEVDVVKEFRGMGV